MKTDCPSSTESVKYTNMSKPLISTGNYRVTSSGLIAPPCSVVLNPSNGLPANRHNYLLDGLNNCLLDGLNNYLLDGLNNCLLDGLNNCLLDGLNSPGKYCVNLGDVSSCFECRDVAGGHLNLTVY